MSNWSYKIINSDCLEAMKAMDDNSIDSIVTDPPYGLSFMGKKWDYDVPGVEVWKECLRILKPGGHLLAFAGTRTQHRMAVRIEDAGFEIRDMIAWVYGSGFPKSLNIGKAIDKLNGNLNETTSTLFNNPNGKRDLTKRCDYGYIYNPINNNAKQWNGWGTALKPAFEPITVARKPLQGTVAANVLEHGTGALNINGCRVERDADDTSGWSQSGSKASDNRAMSGGNYARESKPDADGRFPANFIHDGSDEVVGMFPRTGGGKFTIGGTPRKTGGHVLSGSADRTDAIMNYGDSGSAARFFYCAKASKAERDAGCDGLPLGEPPASARSKPADGRQNALGNPRSNHHPTVKPIDLMRYLCRLVTPPKGTILDPFMGSGTTLLAAFDEGFNCIGIERDSEYAKIAEARIKSYSKQKKIF